MAVEPGGNKTPKTVAPDAPPVPELSTVTVPLSLAPASSEPVPRDRLVEIFGTVKYVVAKVSRAGELVTFSPALSTVEAKPETGMVEPPGTPNPK